ncbi:MAG TPA: thymidine phosphorylase [Patescibacteria group bacterium]|nr:thymidine phosphorylase [Patescibacteria group bacterium]
MELKIKLLNWSTGFPVVMLNEKTAEKLGIYSKDRIFIKTLSKNKASQKISSIVDTIEDLITEKELAVSSELQKALNLKKGQRVDISLAPMSKSLTYIKKKLDGKELSRKELEEIINDLVKNSLSEAEMALFISAMYRNGTTMKETISLIYAIEESGNTIKWKKGIVADKHSIGGIPGNRTTPLVVSICVAGGLIVPKTSSRAITTAAGTADVLETITRVEFSIPELKKIINKTGGCMVWGGGLGIVPADDKIIKIEKILEIDPEAQLLASIMGKKLSMGAKYILIDIPYGKNTKVSRSQALKLKKKFEYIGRYFHKKMDVVLTGGSQPIGNGVGPSLELMDIVKILKRENSGENYPLDLEKKSLFLAGQIFEMTGKAKKGKGIELAKRILDSGKAFEKFKEIIEAQGGDIKRLRYGKLKKTILASGSGKIKEINNKDINSLARVTGCPANKFSGIYLYHHVGDKITKGDKLLDIYSDSKAMLQEAVKFYNEQKPISIK